MGERLPVQKSFICSYSDCDAAFSKAWKLEAHLCRHTGLKPFSCEKCDKRFCTRYQLSRHELSHSEDKPHKCLTEGCSQAFVTKASLRNHMMRVHHHHHQEKSFQCDRPGCGQEFKKRDKLKAHKCEQHEEPPAFHCSFTGCTMEFSSQGKLKHHRKVHAGYPCETEGCPFQGKTWTEYLKHKKEHKVKVPCGQCKKHFNSSRFLHLHELRAHSGQPKRTFSCPKEGCDRKFSRSLSLESHVLGDHEGRKPFSCAYQGCGRSFAIKENLWRHGVVHDPVKNKLKKKLLKSARMRRARRAAGAADEAETNKLSAKLQDVKL